MNLAGIIKALTWLSFTFVYAYAVGGRVPYLIFYTSLGLLMVGFIWAVAVRKVSCHCYVPAGRSQAGLKVKFTMEVINNSGWPVPWVQCWVKMPESFCLPDNLACYTLSLAPHEKKVLTEELEYKLRGRFSWGSILLRTGDIFGVFTNSVVIGEDREVLVLPKFHDLGGILARVGGGQFGEISSSIRQGRRGSGFLGVRKYDAGDGISRIHWKASARLQNLLVKEFEEQKSTEMVIVLDLYGPHHSGLDPAGTAEKAVTLAASLAAFGARSGCGTGLVVCGCERSVIPVGYGHSHFEHILETLVHVRADEKDICYYKKFAGEIPYITGRGFSIIITGQLEGSLVDSLLWMKARRRHCMVFLFRQETFEGGHAGPDDQEMAAKLRNYGIPVIMLEKDTDIRLAFGGLEYGAS